MIGFDIDGVIADSTKCFESEFLKRFNYNPFANNTTFMFNVPNADPVEVSEAVDYCINQVEQTEVIPHSKEALLKIYELTRKPIQFITARPIDRNKASTLYWLDTHFKKFKYVVHFVKSSEKAKFLYENGYMSFVEDRLRTANQVAGYLPTSYLVNRSYNQNRYTHPSVIRIDNLLDVYNHCVKG